MLYLALVLLAQPATEPARTPAPPAEVRRVVAALVRAAEEGGGVRGDALADVYVRRMARAALEEKVSCRAFLVGLGVALDDTNLARGNVLLRAYLAQVETDAERQRRLRVLGAPTLRGRHDWLLHFAVSAALAAHLDIDAAERFGILKESLDARGTSGFSFADLAADFAGTALAAALLEDEERGQRRLRRLAEGFRGDDFLPDLRDLREGLSWETFQRDYGGTQDPRFITLCTSLRRRVRQVPGHERLIAVP